MRYLIIFLLFTTVTVVTAQKKELTIVSWNIQNFGQSKNVEEMNTIADIVKHADIIAIQEVVSSAGGRQAVVRLTEALKAKGESWDYLLSDKTNSAKYMTERYAIIWKNEHIKIKKEHQGRLLKELDAKVDREPFLIEFFTADTSFFIMNYHAKSYSKNPRVEVKQVLEYTQEKYADKKFILAGDFNLSQTEEVFNDFKLAGFMPVHLNEKTTLKRKCKEGLYVNYPIDNIFYSTKIKAISKKVIDFVKNCKNLKKSRFISDHLPVELKFTF